MTLRRTGGKGVALALLGVLACALLLVPDAPPDTSARAGDDADLPLTPGVSKKRTRDKYDKVVEQGLEWLALHQAADGHWGLHDFPKHARTSPGPGALRETCNCLGAATRHNDIAGTAFGLLPFLGAGQTNKPSARAWPKDYSATVAAGLNYLVAKQHKDGYYSGDIYAHGLATIAMCEAYGLTSDPKWKRSAQRALNFIVTAQSPRGGGWRYVPRSAVGDVSVTGWQVAALRAGRAAGLKVPRATFRKVDRFLDSCESADKSGYGYMPGSAPSYTLTAVGLLCRQYLGMNPRNPTMLKGIARLKRQPPGTTRNLYYEYYATQVMYNMGGEIWKFWEKGPAGDGGIFDSVARNQDVGRTPKRAHQKGSWDPTKVGCGEGGRLMSTALSLRILQERDRDRLTGLHSRMITK